MQALLVLGGDEIPLGEYAKEADIIICADSGADSAVRQKIIPDVLIGDMDSISRETLFSLKKREVKIIEHPIEKDKTDAEISLDYVKQIGASKVRLVCVEGSIDHYMGNLYLLLYAKKIGLKAYLETSDMTVYAVSEEFSFKGESGKRVSVLPADGEITILEPSGLYYALNSPTQILPGQTLGLGNHMTGDECTINILKGTAFVFLEKN